MVASEGKKAKSVGFSERIKEGWQGSMRSLGRVEEEGERLLKGIGEFSEKVVPEGHRKALEELVKDAVNYVGQLNDSVEENTRKILERLNVPTRKELDEFNKRVQVLVEDAVKARIERLRVPSGKDLDQLGKQMKRNVEEQTLKVFGRLNIATRKDVDAVIKEVNKLRKDVNAIMNTAAAAPRKPAAVKKKTNKKAGVKKTGK